tara:strand:- start:11719 stop:11919 length:201 start_codon:yes stop_codon:yes gene_type:complete
MENNIGKVVRVVEQPSIIGEIIRMDGHKFVIREYDIIDDEGDNTLIFHSDEVEFINELKTNRTDEK